MAEEIVITTKALTKRYKTVTAVNNLDLEIPKGSIFGFLGPNGAGKTTTIRILLGLVAPTSGQATILGHDIVKGRSEISKKVGAIIETPAFYQHLSGIDNLKVFMQSSNLLVNRSRIDQLIEMVGLKGRERENVKNYSLGMRQRLGIAATLLVDPLILFLDEPTNGLDPAGTVEMRNLIKSLGEQGHTIFLSSHLLNEVEQICTDVMIVQKGEKKLLGKMDELLSQSQGFAIQATPLDLAYSILKRHCNADITIEDTEWLLIKKERAEIPDMLRILIENKIDIYQVQERRNSLEDLFLELTGQPTAQPQVAMSGKGK